MGKEKTALKNLTIDELEKYLERMGQKRFRAAQIAQWVYGKRAAQFSEMTNLSKPLIDQLQNSSAITKLPPKYIMKSQSGDAVKFGFELSGSSFVIESVLLLDDKRRTACISSQLGCALGCTFCETAKLGFIRNLTQEEIVGQIIGINDYLYSQLDKLVTNIVFMGMGEALSNFDNFTRSLSLFMDKDIFNIGGRKITVSTAGVIPSIERLMNLDLNIGLAISLNSWNNELRNRYMPVNRKYPIEQLVAIAQRYFEKSGRRVTFEYVLIKGVTDTSQAVSRLGALLGKIPCKINLIPLNSADESSSEVPSENSVVWFSEALKRIGLSVMIRKSRGRDIMGACGQLTATHNRSSK